MSNVARGPAVTADERRRVLNACIPYDKTVEELAVMLQRSEATVRAMLQGLVYAGLLTRERYSPMTGKKRWLYVYRAVRDGE